METSVEYEFLRERRYRPALSAQSIIRWPTASDPDLGVPGYDYSFGLIASKDFIYFDLDLNILYTWVGDREESDNVQIALASEWHINRRFDMIAEVVTTIGGSSGRVRRGRWAVSAFREQRSSTNNVTEGTLGLAWHATRSLKFAQGVTYSSDHSWQFIVAWEWSFGGD